MCAELGQPTCCVETDAMLAIPGALRTAPGRFNGEHSRQRIERALVSDHRTVVCLPPIAGEKPGHDAVATASVPHENTARLEHARHLLDDHPIVARIDE